MANVTVLGAGGATVTISLTSDQNAAAANAAGVFINKQVTAGILDQLTFTGSGTLPAPANILGGAVVSTAGNVGALTSEFISVLVNAAGNSTVIGAANAKMTVIGGDSSNLTYGNLSANGNVFLGNGTNVLANFQGSANVTATGGTQFLLTDSDAITTANIGGATTILTTDISGKSGAATINVDAGSKATVLAAGSSTIPAAVKINAVDGTLFLANYDMGRAIINPGAADVTVVGGLSTSSTVAGADYGGRVILFGGSGNVVVANGQGQFTGGSGKNLMFTSTVAGSATLTGGSGSENFLISQGTGQVLIAGAGNATLFGRFDNTGGNTFVVGNSVQTTVFGGGQGANTFAFSGLGSAEVDGRNEAAPGSAIQNVYFNQDVDGDATKGGTFFISDFVTGTDQLLLQAGETAAVTYFARGAGGSPLGSIGGTQVVVSSGATYNFFESGALGQDIFQSDVKNIGGAYTKSP